MILAITRVLAFVLSCSLLLRSPVLIFAQTPPGLAVPHQINLIVVEGEGAINNVKQRVSREAVVQVEDENHKPIAGAAVTFTLPTQGASGTFLNGARTITVLSDNQGRAVARGLRPNTVQGKLEVRVNAKHLNEVATTTITMTNMLPVGAAVASGVSIKLITILAIAGAAAAGGVVAATRGGGGSAASAGGSPTPPPTGPVGIVITPGTPSAGGPSLMNRNSLLQLILGGGLVALPAVAQSGGSGSDTSVTGPTLGFTIDSTQLQLRPILGLPGSAVLGPTATLPFPVSRLLLAPGSRWALAQDQTSSGWSVLTDLAAATAKATPVPDCQAAGDLVTFSTDGAAAAVYSASLQSVQVLSGLPNAPVLSRTIDLSRVPGTVTALAVTSDGGTLLAGASTDSGGALLVLSDSQAPARQIATAGRLSALAFVAGGPDALWADADRNQIVRLRDPGGAAEMQVLATGDTGVASPVAVAADSKHYLALMSGGRLLSLPRSDGDAQTLDCGCAATTLSLLPGDNLWRLNEGGTGPLWVFDATAARLFFVPGGSNAQ